MNWRDLITAENIARLEANWREQQPVQGTDQERDFTPVCRLLLPFTQPQFLWLLTELEPGTSLAFGGAQLTEFELGYIDLEELAAVQHSQGLRVILDTTFRSEMTLSDYARLARKHGGLLYLG